MDAGMDDSDYFLTLLALLLRRNAIMIHDKNQIHGLMEVDYESLLCLVYPGT